MARFASTLMASLLAGGLALASTSANALVIGAGDITGDGSVNFFDAGPWSASSTPRNFKSKTLNGFTGLGVAGGYVDGEIDLQNSERITFTFDTPQRLDELTLAFLFKDGNFGDTVSEVARIQLAVDGFVAGDLSVITNTTATWSGAGGGPVTNLSPGNESGAGVWKIANPFGNMAVTSFSMYALLVGGPNATPSSANSDFSFVSMKTSDVPVPASLMLLGTGVLGLGFLRRRQNA